MKNEMPLFFKLTLALTMVAVLGPSPAEAQLQLGIKTQPSTALTIAGPSGAPVQVQRADDQFRWAHLTNLVLTASLMTVADPNAATTGSRFYRAVTLPSTEMVLVPAGSFQVGDTLNEGTTNELPLHVVYVSAFYMERGEVTWQLWQSVYSWALTNGYSLDHAGIGKAPNHPVHSISWFDAVKWCNARSQMENLTPVYYLDAGFVTLYRAGQASLWTNHVNWKANGYRLPTEAEWERAARGGAAGKRFPWGDLIRHDLANYYSVATYAYDVSATRAYHPLYAIGGMPYTNPHDAFSPNEYGLFGMADNICEWCWDWFDAGFYGKPAASQNNTCGPRGDSLTYRVRRGGSWNIYPNKARTAFRDFGSPTDATSAFGFRCVRSL